MKLIQSRLSVVFLLFGLMLAGCKTGPTTTESTPIAPRLIEPLKFANFTVSDISSLEGASNLMNEKVYLGEENADPADFDWAVTDQTTNLVHCETIKDFKAQVQNKSSDETWYGRIKYQWVDACADTLDFMAKARPSQHSYLAKNYFMDLPGSILLGGMSGEQEAQLDRDKLMGLRFKDYTKPSQTLYLTDFKYMDGGLRFRDSVNDYGYLVKELARGDWDGDGNEDALILVAWHTEGTLGGSFTRIVTRTGLDREPKWVATDQFLKCSPNIVKLEGTIKEEVFPRGAFASTVALAFYLVVDNKFDSLARRK